MDNSKKDLKKEYDKIRYAKNKSLIKNQCNIYRIQNRAKINLQKKQYRLNYKEKIKRDLSLWYSKNKNYVKTKSIQYRLKNKAKIFEQKRADYYKNRALYLSKHKDYYLKNKDYIKNYAKQYCVKNKNSIVQKRKEYYAKEENKIKHKQYYFQNKERFRGRDSDYRIRKYKSDSLYRLNIIMSNAIKNSLLKKGKKKNGCKWESIVGYTKEQLREHLYQKSVSKIKNYGEKSIDIDHKTPKSWFNYSSITDLAFRNAWSLENLQLLSHEENIQKKNCYCADVLLALSLIGRG